jgi:hypothetical protein
VHEAAGLVLQQAHALGVVELWDTRGDEAQDEGLRGVLGDVSLEQPVLRPAAQVLVGEVDAELVERVGA